MSVDYAAGLSHYEDLGICGLDEVFDKWDEVKTKVATLVGWLHQFKGSCVVHVGAGLSTAAGIRDFRGKGGVWTELVARRSSRAECRTAAKEEMEKAERDEPPSKCETISFDQAEPTKSHLILKALCELGFVSHIVSQNVDGLFLKSNLRRNFISELHGNFYLDECTKCRSRFIRGSPSATMRLQKSHIKCLKQERPCTGHLRDTILDWESAIPHNELRTATCESKRANLHICIGTSLQLRPSKDLVCKPNKTKRLVLINLQPTSFDKQANLVINYYADQVMTELAKQMDLNIPTYQLLSDPTKDDQLIGKAWEKKVIKHRSTESRLI